jgi:hypothetical protein
MRRRLFEQNEDVQCVADVDRRKKLLEELYVEKISEYSPVLRRIFPTLMSKERVDSARQAYQTILREAEEAAARAEATDNDAEPDTV